MRNLVTVDDSVLFIKSTINFVQFMNNKQSNTKMVELIGEVIASDVETALQIMKHGNVSLDRQFLFVDETKVIDIRSHYEKIDTLLSFWRHKYHGTN